MLEDQLLLQRWLQDPVLLVLLDAVSRSVLLAQLLVLEVLVLVSEVDSQVHLEASEALLASLVVAVLLAGHLDSLPLVGLLDSEHHQASEDRPASLVVVDLPVSVAGRRRTTKGHDETLLERFGLGRSNTARTHIADLWKYLGKGIHSRPTLRKEAGVPIGL
jgi:hypothetical protein